jgi:hypothetical protein
MSQSFRILVVSAIALAATACSSSSTHSSTPGDSGVTSDSEAKDGQTKTDAKPTSDAPTKDGQSSGDAPSPSTIAGFCPDYLAAQAAHLATCANGYGPKAAWLIQLEAGDTCAKMAAAVTAKRVTFDPSKAQACLTAYAALTCTAGVQQGVPSDCIAALSGTVAKGGTCYDDIDCSAGDYCAGADPSLGICEGKCAAKVAAAATCKLGEQCVTGYSCYVTSTSKDAGEARACSKTLTTIPGAAKGATCGHDKTTQKTTTCAEGLSCNVSTLKCVDTAKEGQACTPGASVCESFTSCDPTNNTCKQYPIVGGNCGDSTGQDPVLCLGNTYCKPSSATSKTGTCAAQGSSGVACLVAEQCITSDCKKASKDAGVGTCTAPCTEM